MSAKFYSKVHFALIFFCILTPVFFVLISELATRFPVVDEIGHLPAGVSHWKFERFDLYRVNPPLVRGFVTLPAYIYGEEFEWDVFYQSSVGSRAEFNLGIARLRHDRLSFVSAYFLPRVLAIFVLGLSSIFLLYRTTGFISDKVGFIAVVYLSYSPNSLSNLAIICPDYGSLVAGLFASLACYRYLLTASTAASIVSGFALGLALLSKLTWISALVAFPLTTAVCIFTFRKFVSQRTLRVRIVHLLLFWLVGFFTLNAGYLFEDSFRPLVQYEFCSEASGGEGCNARVHGNRFKDSWFADVPVPVPRNYLLGIDYLRYEVEWKMWSFLNGEWKYGSWPHYYIMTTLYKTPEPTLLGAALGLGVLIVGIWRKMVTPEVISMFLFLIIPAAVCFASVSLQGGFNHHHRYVLMIYPPMFALAAYIASPVGILLLRFRLPFLGPEKRSIAVPLALTLAVLSAASSLRVHPYYTSYFNTLSGGPENGWRLLGFSNIDWGQDILEVDKWLKAHPDRRPLVMDIDYFEMNGNLFDVPTSDPPQLPKGASVDEVRRSITETQWWIISVKKLYNLPDQEGLEYLQQLQPVERIAYSYHVYRIDPLPADPQAPIQEPMQEPMQE
jgi:hypothetical protein